MQILTRTCGVETGLAGGRCQEGLAIPSRGYPGFSGPEPMLPPGLGALECGLPGGWLKLPMKLCGPGCCCCPPGCPPGWLPGWPPPGVFCLGVCLPLSDRSDDWESVDCCEDSSNPSGPSGPDDEALDGVVGGGAVLAGVELLWVETGGIGELAEPEKLRKIS